MKQSVKESILTILKAYKDERLNDEEVIGLIDGFTDNSQLNTPSFWRAEPIWKVPTKEEGAPWWEAYRVYCNGINTVTTTDGNYSDENCLKM